MFSKIVKKREDFLLFLLFAQKSLGISAQVPYVYIQLP